MVRGHEFGMDELWEQHVRQSREHETRLRQWLEEEVYTVIRELRAGESFKTHLDIRVVVPVCDPCVHSEYRYYEEPKPVPDVFGPAWKEGYLSLGFSKKEIKVVARGLDDGSWLPRCRRCGSRINLSAGEDFHVRRVGISEYFDLYVGAGGHIPKWMKKAVREVFGVKCAACQREATTLDHIVAKVRGGVTEVANLQPLCEECNARKADGDVEVVEVDLTFPLRPPPSDGFEGFIW